MDNVPLQCSILVFIQLSVYEEKTDIGAKTPALGQKKDQLKNHAIKVFSKEYLNVTDV